MVRGLFTVKSQTQGTQPKSEILVINSSVKGSYTQQSFLSLEVPKTLWMLRMKSNNDWGDYAV